MDPSLEIYVAKPFAWCGPNAKDSVFCKVNQIFGFNSRIEIVLSQCCIKMDICMYA